MAEDTNEVLFKKLYSKLAAALSVGTPQAVPGQNYLALCNPGILLDPELKAESEGVAERTWSALLDNIPEPNWVYTPTNTQISSVFKGVLEGKELANVGLTAEQKTKLEAARAIVMTEEQPSKKFKAYQAYRKKYQEAQTAYQSAVATAANSGKEPPAELLENLNEARSEWSTFGFREEVEAANATIANLQQLDPNTWWKRLENAYANATVTAGKSEFELSNTYPDYASLVGEKGWTGFTFNEEEAVKQTSASAVEAGGGVEGGWGLWRVSAEAGYGKKSKSSSSDATALSISLELMRATIMRPWLDPLVFRAHSWRFSKSSNLYGKLISKGSFVPGGSGEEEGLLPMLPTGIVVARNVKIEGKFSHEDQSTVEKELKGGGSVGWGPFAIQGHYSQSESSSISHGSMTATSVANADPQIIGFFCDVLPLSPSPDQTLPWPS
jgi:hypothetical protein